MKNLEQNCPMSLILRLGLLENRKNDETSHSTSENLRKKEKNICKLQTLFSPIGKKGAKFEIQGADWIRSCTLVQKAESVRK